MKTWKCPYQTNPFKMFLCTKSLTFDNIIGKVYLLEGML